MTCSLICTFPYHLPSRFDLPNPFVLHFPCLPIFVISGEDIEPKEVADMDQGDVEGMEDGMWT